MPTTENDRRNLQQPSLENPSLPDHDRRRDAGMHRAISTELPLVEDEVPLVERAPRLDDPSRRLTSEPPSPESELDSEDNGDSLVDLDDPDRH